MTVLLVYVLPDGAAHPLILLSQLAAGGHQERHSVAHVVVSLCQKGEVGLPADVAAAAGLDDGGIEQVLALGGGGVLQGLVEAHEDSPVRP
ncbi:hypothetical protein D3C74_456390 [compost metagenome]